MKQVPSLSHCADEESEARRSEGHRQLERMESRFTPGLEGRQPWAHWLAATLQVGALEGGGGSRGELGKGTYVRACGRATGAVGKGLPLDGDKPWGWPKPASLPLAPPTDRQEELAWGLETAKQHHQKARAPASPGHSRVPSPQAQE